MKTGIIAEDIMNMDFPVVDSSVSIEKCIQKMGNKYEACIILEQGLLKNILSYDDLLKVFLKRKLKNLPVGRVETSKDFVIITPETDLIDVIRIMKDMDVDFLVAKKENTIGLITKKEVAEINQYLFDSVTRRQLVYT